MSDRPPLSPFASLARRGMPLGKGEPWPEAGVHLRVRRGTFRIPAGLGEGDRKRAIAQRIHPDANNVSVRREGRDEVITWRIIRVHPNE